MEATLLEILNNTKFITVSTVCADGSPWATPIGWFAFDGGNIVFDNRQGTIHAENLARDNRCFIAIVNYDKPRSRAVYVPTRATKLSGVAYEKAKTLILNKGLDVTDDIFSAPIGKIDEAKSKIGAVAGKDRFHCYMKGDTV